MMVYLVMTFGVVVKEVVDIKMTKQEILDKLEEISDSMDTDFLNRHAIEGIVDDIKDLQWKINIGLEIGIE